MYDAFAASSAPAKELTEPNPEFSGPKQETLDWFINCVWPALKQVANTDLMSFADLYRAAESLDATEATAWTSLIGRLHHRVARASGVGSPNDSAIVRLGKTLVGSLLWIFRDTEKVLRYRTFEGLIEGINADWLLPRGLLLRQSAIPHLPSFSVPDVWEGFNLSLAEILHRKDYRFVGGVVELYVVRHILPSEDCYVSPPAFYDCLGRRAVIEDGYLREQVWQIKLYARADDMLERYLTLTRRWSSDYAKIEKRFCRWLDQRYPKAQDLFHTLFLRVLSEEVRHGMDAQRAGHVVDDPRYPRRLVETLLRPDGRLRCWFDEPEWHHGAPPLLCGQPLDVRSVVSELSAQLTAAAMPDPALMIREWGHKLARHAIYAGDRRHLDRALKHHAEHALVSLLCTALLREHLQGVALPPWRELAEPDFEAAAACAWQLGNRTSNELRSALKAIFQEHFIYPIDEAPFAEITSEGNLRNRS